MVAQYDVYLVNLDPTIGTEIKKTRPCVVISPNEMNRHLSTVIFAPMTTQSRNYPMRLPVTFKRKKGWVVLDQIRTVDKARLVKKLGALSSKEASLMKQILKEMLVD